MTTTPKHLTKDELEQVFYCAKRVNFRLYVALFLCYRHALRRNEVMSLEWSNVKFKQSTIIIPRLKGSNDANHTLQSDEAKVLRKLKSYNDKLYGGKFMGSPYLFPSRVGGHLTDKWFNKCTKEQISEAVGFKVTIHMMKHSCGIHLAENGEPLLDTQRFMGHKQIANTMVYLEAASIDTRKITKGLL